MTATLTAIKRDIADLQSALRVNKPSKYVFSWIGKDGNPDPATQWTLDLDSLQGQPKLIQQDSAYL